LVPAVLPVILNDVVIKILLVALVGVIVTDNPLTSTIPADVVLVVFVVVVVTT
jgi:hypothetical protein